MSDKAIVITEKKIMTRFDEMCQETLSPDVYSIWADQIIPALNKIRTGLQPTPMAYCPSCGGELTTGKKVKNGKD